MMEKKICILGYSKCVSKVESLIGLRDAQIDLNLHWAHMSEGMFPDVN